MIVSTVCDLLHFPAFPMLAARKRNHVSCCTLHPLGSQHGDTLPAFSRENRPFGIVLVLITVLGHGHGDLIESSGTMAGNWEVGNFSPHTFFTTRFTPLIGAPLHKDFDNLFGVKKCLPISGVTSGLKSCPNRLTGQPVWNQLFERSDSAFGSLCSLLWCACVVWGIAKEIIGQTQCRKVRLVERSNQFCIGLRTQGA